MLCNVTHGSVIFLVNHCDTLWVSHDCTWNVKYNVHQVESVSVSVSNAKVMGWNPMGMHELIKCMVVTKGCKTKHLTT